MLHKKNIRSAYIVYPLRGSCVRKILRAVNHWGLLSLESGGVGASLYSWDFFPSDLQIVPIHPIHIIKYDMSCQKDLYFAIEH